VIVTDARHVLPAVLAPVFRIVDVHVLLLSLGSTFAVPNETEKAYARLA
jgi:hypothetical protein